MSSASTPGMNDIVGVAIFENGTGPLQMQKCRINGELHEVPVNTIVSRSFGGDQYASVPYKVAAMLVNAAFNVSVRSVDEA